MELMKQYRVLRLKAGSIELEMAHVLTADPLSSEPTFKDITGIDPLGSPRERKIASALADYARRVTTKDLEEEDGYAD